MRILVFVLSVLMFSVFSLSGMEYKLDEGEAIQTVIDEQQKIGESNSFVFFESSDKFYENSFDLGTINNISRFSGTFRIKSPWMIPVVGKQVKDIPAETQFIIFELKDGSFMMMIPLVSDHVRSSIKGNPDNHLLLIAETGDTLTRVNNFLGLYLTTGSDPYVMIREAWEKISKKLGTFKLRDEKEIPWFVDHFGWCSYNAMRDQITSQKLLAAAQNFENKNIPVRYMIFDVGWQDTDEKKLISFRADAEKFPDGLKQAITSIKETSDIEKVLLWQTLWGYWMGLEEESFPQGNYKVNILPSPRMKFLMSDDMAGDAVAEATVGPNFYPGMLGSEIYVPDYKSYFKDYFSYLKTQGVDGAKVDAIAWVETIGTNLGGRVDMMKRMLNDLESAGSLYFNNEIINCSSCSNDYLMNTLSSNVTRTSMDFFPDKPESHGLHIYANAHNSFWMGDVILPDWDMFQSGHSAGDFHAAARAISGGPIYSTEAIGTENTEILSKLMTSDGRLLRCKNPGRVCLESLFVDPAKNSGFLKIFNANITNYIVGAFNCSYGEEDNVRLSGKVNVSDIEGVESGNFVMYQYSTGEIRKANIESSVSIELNQLEYDLITIVPLVNNVAVIGLTDKYNPGGAINSIKWITKKEVQVELKDGGIFTAYSKKKPKEIVLESSQCEFSYNRDIHKIEVQIPPHGKNVTLKLKF